MKLSHPAALLLGLISAGDAARPNTTPTTYSYAAASTNRYATPLPSPLKPKTYAPSFKSASKLIGRELNYTTWSLDRGATATQDGPYGQSAYAKMWQNISYSSDLLFTTTASPTPVPSSELVFPPELYNKPTPPKKHKLPKDFIWGVGSSAWQVEGALQHEGRGPAFLDYIGALPNTAGLSESLTSPTP